MILDSLASIEEMVEVKIAGAEAFSVGVLSDIRCPSGSHVEFGTHIATIETGKANQEIYAPASGVLHWKVFLEQEFPLKNTLACIETNKIKCSEEIDMLNLSPASAEPSASQSPKRTPLSPMRRTIRQKLLHAQQTIPTATTINQADLTELIGMKTAYQEAFKKKHNCRLSFIPFFIKAMALALKQYPVFTSYIAQEDVITPEHTSINVAVSTEEGSIAPILIDPLRLSIAQIQQKIEGYVEKANQGSLSADDLETGSMTLSNGGVFGSILSTPMLLPNQSGILGIHKIEKRPVVIKDAIAIRPMMFLALTYDHGLIDGREAIGFLQHVCNLVEEPQRLLMEI
jgi:2-oxoglutarate dehydrogenase E2 component (dihydrolipoamide succinyltransferase)